MGKARLIIGAVAAAAMVAGGGVGWTGLKRITEGPLYDNQIDRSENAPPEARFGLSSRFPGEDKRNLAPGREMETMRTWLRAHPERHEFLWLWCRGMMEWGPVFGRYVDRPVRPPTPREDMALALWEDMARTASELDPDNGWSDLLRAMADAGTGMEWYSAPNPDPGKDSAREVVRYVAVRPELTAAAARHLHEAVRRPVFSMYQTELIRGWLEWRGAPGTLDDGIVNLGALAGVLLPQLNREREFARQMMGEVARRAPPLQPEPWPEQTDPDPDDPEPTRPPPGQENPEAAAIWNKWRQRQQLRYAGKYPSRFKDAQTVNPGNVLPEPLPLPPPLPGRPPETPDPLTAYDILEDLQTLAARQIIDDPTLVGMLTGNGIFTLVHRDGVRILTAAGRSEEAERLLARGRRLQRPYLLTQVSHQLFDARTHTQDVNRKRTERLATEAIYRDPSLWSEAEALIAQATRESAKDRQQAMVDVEHAGGLASMLFPALGRVLPVGMELYRPGDFNAIRRVEFYAGYGWFIRSTVAVGLTVILAVFMAALVWSWYCRNHRRPLAFAVVACLLAAGLATLAARVLMEAVGVGEANLVRLSAGERVGIGATQAMFFAGVSWLVFLTYWRQRREATLAPPVDAAPPSLRRAGVLGLLFFAASWLFPVLFTELPGTPSHETGGILAGLFSNAIGGEGGLAALFAHGPAGYPADFWLVFGYAWGFTLAFWIVAFLAAPTVAEASAPATPRGLFGRIRDFLRWNRRPYPLALVLSVATFAVAWIGGGPVSGPRGAAADSFFAATGNIGFGLAMVFLAVALFGLVLRYRRIFLDGAAGPRWLCLGAVTLGLLLWLTVGCGWARYGEGYWVARERIILPHPGADAFCFSKPETLAVEYYQRETRKYLAEKPATLR